MNTYRIRLALQLLSLGLKFRDYTVCFSINNALGVSMRERGLYPGFMVKRKRIVKLNRLFLSLMSPFVFHGGFPSSIWKGFITLPWCSTNANTALKRPMLVPIPRMLTAPIHNTLFIPTRITTNVIRLRINHISATPIYSWSPFVVELQHSVAIHTHVIAVWKVPHSEVFQILHLHRSRTEQKQRRSYSVTWKRHESTIGIKRKRSMDDLKYCLSIKNSGPHPVIQPYEQIALMRNTTRTCQSMHSKCHPLKNSYFTHSTGAWITLPSDYDSLSSTYERHTG